MALIFDLTTVATWTRQVVGVVRIERELARWAAAHCDADLIFACHDAAADRVFSLPRDGARAIIAAEIRVEPPRPPARFRARLHQAVRHPRRAIQRMLELVPAAATWAFAPADLEATLTPILGKAVDQTVPARSVRSVTLAELGATPLTPPAGSTLLSLGFGSVEWLNHVRALKDRSALSYVAYCHDLIPLSHPHFVPAEYLPRREDYFADLFWTVDMVLTCSDVVRRDIAAYCDTHDIPVPPIALGPPGCDLAHQPQPPDAAIRPGRYVLYVSAIEPRKNHRFLYDIWREMRREQSLPEDFKLVLVGGGDGGASETIDFLTRDPAVAASIVVLNDTSDAELAWLYRMARICVHPSLAEGYGIPVAEALSFGKACICSDDPVLVEQFGHSTPHLPLDRRADWKRLISRLCGDDGALRAAEERIAQCYVPFSWERAATALFSAVDAFRRKTG